MTVQTQKSYCDRVRKEKSKSRGWTEEKSCRNSNRDSNLNVSRSRSCSREKKLREKERILELELEIEAIKIRMAEERLEKMCMEERTEKILSLNELRIERQQDLILELLRYLNQELLPWLQPQQPQSQQCNCDKINVYNQDNYRDISYAGLVK